MANMKRAREQSRMKLAKQGAELGRMQAAVDSATYKPMEFQAPCTATDETPVVAVFVNEHRNTCIRVAVGRKKTAFIPMDAGGIMVKRVSHDVFKTDWRLTLANYAPAGAADSFLNSYAAKHYLSNEARTLLMEISSTGALNSTVKENGTMEATTATETKATKPAAAAKGSAAAPAKGKAAAPAKGKAAAPAKSKATPAKGKAAALAKAAANPAPAAKPKGVPKAPAEATIKPLVKVSDVVAREGTWTRFMIITALGAKTVGEAQKKVDANKEFAGRRVDTNWLVNKGYIKLAA